MIPRTEAGQRALALLIESTLSMSDIAEQVGLTRQRVWEIGERSGVYVIDRRQRIQRARHAAAYDEWQAGGRRAVLRPRTFVFALNKCLRPDGLFYCSCCRGAEIRKAYMRCCARCNREKVNAWFHGSGRERFRQWCRANPEKLREHQRRYQARKKAGLV
jgi:hypothetical protein